jgi:2-amino-4-hydroxy-6-hydroxymethyldihydropteridine diphosphokinase
MPRAFIAFGGNVGDARDTITHAIETFCDGDKVRLVASSSDYRTPPWGVTDQPPFINACIEIETALAPHQLLERAHDVERAFGRDRASERHWGPRTLDIDLLTYGDIRLDDPDLVLPHPRLFERAFVLVPLAEIAPDRIIAGQRIRDACRGVDSSGIEKLSDIAAPR